CMALTRTRPSRIPLLARAASTCGVMLRNPIRAGTLKVRYSVSDFMRKDLQGRRVERPPQRGGERRGSSEEVGAEVFQAAIAREESDGRARLGSIEELPGRRQVRTGREAGEDAFLGREVTRGFDRLVVGHLEIPGHQFRVEQGEVLSAVAGAL